MDFDNLIAYLRLSTGPPMALDRLVRIVQNAADPEA